MSYSPPVSSGMPLGDGKKPLAPPAAARMALRLLENLAYGTLEVTTPAGTIHRFGQGEPQAAIVLSNWNVAMAALRHGDVGFGETFMAGDWTTPDLGALMDLMVGNRKALEAVFYGSHWTRWFARLRHFLNRNSVQGSRRNIRAHYDIGNDFYTLWLDPGMTYSAALYPDGSTPSAVGDDLMLSSAQDAKYARVLDEIAVRAGARVLEIGCGWGGFMEAAARRGIHVKGLTLSTEQREHALARLAEKGFPDLACVELMDYRDETGQFDAVVSIEMFEAVGEAYWPRYFETLRDRLAPGGRALVQTITIDESLFEAYRAGTDFIQQYIFPGGMLASHKAFVEGARNAGLKVTNALAFGKGYARTLAAWHRRFLARVVEVRRLGFDDRFIRMWSFYLAYCEAAFAHGNTDVVQFTLTHA